MTYYDHPVEHRWNLHASQSGGILIGMLLLVLLFTSVTLAASTANTLTGWGINSAQARSA